MEEHIRTMPLTEERLVPRTRAERVGEAIVHVVVDEVPAVAHVDLAREGVDVERVSVDEIVDERLEPWQDEDTLVVPIYEERLVTTKQLVLKETLRIRRTVSTERRTLEDTVRRERVVVEQVGDARVRVHEPSEATT